MGSMGGVTPREQLAATVAARQAAGGRVVFTNGVFDLLHLGHVQYLQRARALGDFLVIGVNSDTSTTRLKGPSRPLVPEDERAQLLAALACVDAVTLFSEDTAIETLRLLRPLVYVKGADYAGGDAARATDTLLDAETLRRVVAGDAPNRDALAGLADRLPEARIVADYGGSLALLTYLPGHSTSELIARIVERFGNRPEA